MAFGARPLPRISSAAPDKGLPRTRGVLFGYLVFENGLRMSPPHTRGAVRGWLGRRIGTGLRLWSLRFDPERSTDRLVLLPGDARRRVRDLDERALHGCSFRGSFRG